MNRHLFIVMALLAMIGFSHAFELSAYMYANEKSSDIKTSSFSYNGNDYTLYEYKEKPILLARDDYIVKDKKEIESAITSYYMEKYYPSQKELQELGSIVENINKSRNDGSEFGSRGEELNCRYILADMYGDPYSLEIFKNDIYYYYSAFACSALSEAIGCNDPEMIYDDLKLFVSKSRENDVLMANMFNYVNEINKENIGQNLKSLKSDLEKFEENGKSLEKSMFRIPADGVSECKNCFGICGSVKYDKNAIAEEKEKINSLVANSAPLVNLQGNLENLNSETSKRINYKEGTQLKTTYGPKIEELELKWLEKEETISESLKQIIDDDISSQYNILKDEFNSINGSLASLNFSNMDKKIDDFYTLLESTYSKAEANQKAYEEIADMKNLAEINLLIMEQQGYDQVYEFKNEKEKLDFSFEDGITHSSIESYKQDYAALSEQVIAIRNAGKLDVKAGNFIRKASSPFVSSMAKIASMLPNELQAYLTPNISAIASILLGMFIFSAAVLLSIFIYSSIDSLFGMNIHSHGFRFIYFGVMGLIALIGFSIGVLSYLPHSSGITQAPADSIISAMEKYGELYIVVQVPASEKENLMNCAEKMQEGFAEKGISAKIGTYNSWGECELSGQEAETIGNCMLNAKPIILIRESDVNKLYGSDTGLIRLNVEGNNKFIKNCAIASII